MPYVSIRASQHLTDEKIERIQKEMGRIITIIPGKTSENCMTQIAGDCKTFMGGVSINAAFCEVRMLGKAPSENKNEFTVELNNVLSTELEGLERLYLNFQEYYEWGVGPNYREIEKP